MTTRIAAVLAALLVALPAGAQGGATSVVPMGGAARTDSLVTDTARLNAARDLLVALQVEQQMRTAQHAMLDAMAATAHPAIRQVMESWLDKYASFATMRDDLTQLYARTFTRDEMRKTIDFFHTPAGKHFADASPTLMQDAMRIGQRTAQAHTAELQEAIQAKIRELQGQAPAPPAKP